GGGCQRGRDRIEGRGGAGGVRDRVDDDFLQGARAPEQHLALVGEMAKEGALGESRPRGDVLHGGLGVAALLEELPRSLFEPSPRIRFPSPHTIYLTRLQ